MTCSHPTNKLFFIFLLVQLNVAGQVPAKPHRFVIKAGINTTYQLYDNLPAYTLIPVAPDTVWQTRGGEYNRTGLSVMLYYETLLSAKITLIGGLGYRQKGFNSEGGYDPATGIVVPGKYGVYASNRLDYITADVGLKWMPVAGSKLIPYALLLNRLGALAGMKVPFWSTPSGKYGGYRQFEYSPVVAAGLEVPLKGWVFGKRNAERTPGRPYTRLLIEAEYNPGIMNMHKGTDRYLPGSPLQVRSPGFATPLPVQINRGMYNHSAGLSIGIIF